MEGTDARIAVVEAGLVEVRKDVHDIGRDLKEIRDDLTKRPQRIDALAITFLASLSTALGATVLTLLIQHS